MPMKGPWMGRALVLVCTPAGFGKVLDDHHAIESTAIHDGLGFLLSHLPPRLHLAIASEPGHAPAGGRPRTTRVAGAGVAGIGR
jgi:hypothetical protein